MPSPAQKIHLIEPGGSGGVFQHTAEIRDLLVGQGLDVTLHTSAPEVRAPSDCECVNWHREIKTGAARKLATALSYVFVTLPHLVRSCRKSDIAHFQGQYKPVLVALTLAILRMRGCKVVYSPHNTFARGRGRVAQTIVSAVDRIPNVTIAFTAADASLLKSRSKRVVYSPLVMFRNEVDNNKVESWRRDWNARNKKVVLFAGQIRDDKRLDVVIQAAASWPTDWVLAVVGEDKGSWTSCERLASRLEVTCMSTIGYLDLPDFVAAVAASDVIVCPYDVASQSAVVKMAADVNTPSVVTDVGGLAESGSVSLVDRDPITINNAIRTALETTTIGSDTDRRDAIRAHLDAYFE